MKTSLFNYNLPPKLIANEPASPRDSSRLLVYNKDQDKIIHDKFFNLDKYLQTGDVLVFNNSKVIPARLLGNKSTGGKAEALLLKQEDTDIWQAMLGTRKPKIGLKLRFEHGLQAGVIKKISEKTWLLKFNFAGPKFRAILAKIGQVPLPHYIRKIKGQGAKIKDQYQTVYAKKDGSAAAPTAGLHFTNRLLKKLKNRGVQLEFITLHVGLGTFAPVNTENIEDFKIHTEYIEVDSVTIKSLEKAKQQSRRIIAVGTTSVRTLETIFSSKKANTKNLNLKTNIYIHPGYKFKFIDAMITNFHLPKSSLLMLVSAFIGRQKTLQLYKLAIKLKYRFYSFGDGMFLS
ncbi:tRNA preQ1(34) S-adenosylmethionine ribosyltransferase-isomerase QueA [Candidatus Falkowbacteria bacterium]|jgi:S-adenosylmethionine:tRNA ribosyltransferase-isomerase|nr:tRNA preQ1(34) S-adenosylmethionine ribosyltransferase-isomerase QueA [Candidatus Falkowbacteria bacterium]MBT5502713.1 tRNA preQ1(34) S-adenosylmethionine ribosyltransferase-isomerase QueA [Candidatus Falkowbacteria bacterium]MBT6573503.1 tRNA preQ1(34) S-adenosylmethionine ribosyltransferase-isomerase QueA [Candidatus Falkowbacteria bacterium]MBT7348053.1 tRNA preQ1(34) S-adenosylmethionine ribosyltransferase-isomerase QueA [Candidatus Falkowbacteria bacterium]MBT7501112.1 tRNA preQ1(34) S